MTGETCRRRAGSRLQGRGSSCRRWRCGRPPPADSSSSETKNNNSPENSLSAVSASIYHGRQDSVRQWHHGVRDVSGGEAAAGPEQADREEPQGGRDPGRKGHQAAPPRYVVQRSAKRRGCLLSYSQAEPGRESTQPRKHLLAEPCSSKVRLGRGPRP